MKKIILLLFITTIFVTAIFSQTKIVCIGNSISQGKISRGLTKNTSIGDSLAEMSYRFWLWEKLDSAGVNIDFVGFYNKYFEQNTSISQHSRYTGHVFPMNNETYYGITTAQFVAGGWTAYPGGLPNFDTRLATYTPDVALIHLGTNGAEDVPQQTSDKEKDIKLIISKLRKKNPSITILLARLITDWKPISKEMARIATELTTNQSIVYNVDMATGFKSDANGTMTFDWVHPNIVGQRFMAIRWYNAFMKVTKVDEISPTAPTNIVLSNKTNSSVDVSWTASTDNNGVNIYNLYINDVFVAETGKTCISLSGYDFTKASDLKVSAVDFMKNESEKSDAVSISTVLETNSENKIKIYQNSKSQITITGCVGSHLNILDFQGKCIFSAKITNSSLVLNTGNLKNGLYLFQFHSNRNIDMHKVLVHI